MQKRDVLIIILAAGKGTRMKSSLPKVLHGIGGRTLLGHVCAAAIEAGAARMMAIVGPGMDAVAAEARRWVPNAETAIQLNQMGTGDAALAARGAIEKHHGNVIFLFGDTPLIRSETIAEVARALDFGADVVVVGFRPADPTGYGRVLRDGGGQVVAIREHKDASEDERREGLCNSGVMGFRSDDLLGILTSIGNANAKGEYYLTDAIEIARARGRVVTAIEASVEDAFGINDRVQLADAEAVLQQRLRRQAMLNGATLVAPDTVHFSYDTRLGRDVTVEPYVVFGPGVVVEDRVTIRAFSHLVGTDRKISSGTRVGEGAEIGPYSRLRPGAQIGRDVHIGNFVEVKNVTVEDGAKANHLAYLGDGRVGAGANIGAGTIFCNYDGFNKHFTDVGKGAFVGSNSSLVAPVKIGDGAFVGSGSVITSDVPADSLAIERSKQEIRDGWAAKFRTLMARRKAAKTG